MEPSTIYTITKDSYKISTNRTLLDLDMIHRYLERSYWSPGVPRSVVKKAIDHSLCFGLYAIAESSASNNASDRDSGRDSGRIQIGFARVVTDFARFAYVADVFVVPNYQGKGLGTWLMQVVTECPMLDDVGWTFLATRDAHGLYEKFGFRIPAEPHKLMSRQDDMAWYNPAMAETHNDRTL